MTWSRDDARQQYNVSGWSAGYFDVGESGYLEVLPGGNVDGPGVNLHTLAHAVRDAGLSWPVLLRFTDILRQQVDRLCSAFDTAIDAAGYGAGYCAIYPVKVNQQRHVIETIVHHGNGRTGLEAGSKAELMAIIGIAPAGGTIICNGYKDAEYIRLALIAQQLGHHVIIVIEKQTELALISKISVAMDVQPRLGVRVRLSSATRGNWQNTGGDRSKFGFTAAGLLKLMQLLRATGMDGRLQLLHCHPGSQISSIDAMQASLQEVALTWVALREAGFPVSSVNVGGGLGVDYEGTSSTQSCSIDYDMQAYARTVVETFANVSHQKNLPAPQLMSESGRALTAHHAVLVTDVIEAEQIINGDDIRAADESPQLTVLRELINQCDGDDPLAVYAQASDALEQLRSRFSQGRVTLEQRAHGESLYYALCRKLQGLLAEMPKPPTQFDSINRLLADKYFCNLSVFQSMPDVWGIDQVFPIMPLQRLDERPQRRAILHDLTCDSDGQFDHYVDCAGIESSLPVHDIRDNEPYLLGFFLLGAYQEILGDMHNLFGDTDAVNVEMTTDGGYRLSAPRQGDRIDGLLRYVDFDDGTLIECYREKIKAAGLKGQEKDACLQALVNSLSSSTYFANTIE